MFQLIRIIMKKAGIILFLMLLPVCVIQAQTSSVKIPDKIVVLTFDDAASTHATFVAPLLKKYHFGATFFICEFPPDFNTDKHKYMSWEQIRKLNRMGFEIGNHTLNHIHVNKMNKERFVAQLDSIEEHCRQHGIPKPVSFAYPGYDTHPRALEVLKEKGYLFARAGGGRPYNPTVDNPLTLSSFSTSGNDKERVLTAIQQAKNGQIVIFTIHGVPDYAHPQVTTPPELFEEYLKYLHDNHYKVIALRDLAKYINIKPRKQ